MRDWGEHRLMRAQRRTPGWEVQRGALCASRLQWDSNHRTLGRGQRGSMDGLPWLLPAPLFMQRAVAVLTGALLPCSPSTGHGSSPSPWGRLKEERRSSQHLWESQKTHTAPVHPPSLAPLLPAAKTGADYLQLLSFLPGYELSREEFSQEVIVM